MTNIQVNHINIIEIWKIIINSFCDVATWLLTVTGGVIQCFRKYGETPYATLNDLCQYHSHMVRHNFHYMCGDCNYLIYLMFILIIPFFHSSNFYICIHHVCTHIHYGSLDSVGTTCCCTPKVVIFGIEDHFRDNYIPNS